MVEPEGCFSALVNGKCLYSVQNTAPPFGGGGFLISSWSTSLLIDIHRAANLVQPTKGIMMAKKRNFKQKKGIHKNETYNHARHTSMQKCSFIMLFFPYKQVIFLVVILVLSAFHFFWEYFSLQLCFKISFLLNLSSNYHFRAVVWRVVCNK